MLDILVITFSRPQYTRLTLSRLLETCDKNMRVWIWHNGSDEPTLRIVEEMSSHPRVHHLHVSPENKFLWEPTNWFWTQSDGEFVSKVDDDCLVPERWAETLVRAHEDNPRLGIVGCWRFYDEDFIPQLAERKIVSLMGGHRLMVNCWVQGSGYVMKRACVDQLGPLRPKESFTDYCIRLALAGWMNGWYFPFLHEEHMDDPRSPFCSLKSDDHFRRHRPLSAVRDNVTTVAEWANRVRFMAQSAQSAPPDPRHYIGWRRHMRSFFNRARRFLGIREPWRLT